MARARLDTVFDMKNKAVSLFGGVANGTAAA
jgi:hypothetical protein